MIQNISIYTGILNLNEQGTYEFIKSNNNMNKF